MTAASSAAGATAAAGRRCLSLPCVSSRSAAARPCNNARASLPSAGGGGLRWAAAAPLVSTAAASRYGRGGSNANSGGSSGRMLSGMAPPIVVVEALAGGGEEQGQHQVDESQVYHGAGSLKHKQIKLQEAITAAEDPRVVLAIYGESGDSFSPINSVTAVYRIARALTSRAGRLRRTEASFITADARFERLVEQLELSVSQLDKVGLENRKWAYHKLVLPSEYRAKAALSLRLLDQAKDLQGDLMDATDVEQIFLMIEDQAEVFNKVNVSTAIHRVARLATTQIPGVKEEDAKAVISDKRFVQLMEMVVEKAGPNTSPRFQLHLEHFHGMSWVGFQ